MGLLQDTLTEASASSACSHCQCPILQLAACSPWLSSGAILIPPQPQVSGATNTAATASAHVICDVHSNSQDCEDTRHHDLQFTDDMDTQRGLKGPPMALPLIPGGVCTRTPDLFPIEGLSSCW